MAVSIRDGQYGPYIGNTKSSSNALSEAEMKTNASYIHKYLKAKGWSNNAIAGILGNMEHESSINPGRWQSDNVGNMSGGYGLTQWTPASKYTEWADGLGYDYSTMDSNLARIIYEVENRIQWIATTGYNYTFEEFTKSTDTPYNLACAFAWNYERSATVLYGTPAEQQALRVKRGGSASKWYEYLTGNTPDEPDDPVIPTTSKRRKYKFILFNRNRRYV